MLEKEDKAYFKLHKKYKLWENFNRKLSNQRCDSFLIKRRIGRFAYELELSLKWKVHSVIFVIQFESAREEDPYQKYKSHYLESMRPTEIQNSKNRMK